MGVGDAIRSADDVSVGDCNPLSFSFVFLPSFFSGLSTFSFFFLCGFSAGVVAAGVVVAVVVVVVVLVLSSASRCSSGFGRFFFCAADCSFS